jgi:hypothetical protein
MNRLSKRAALFYLVAVFLAGLIAGTGLGYLVRDRSPRRLPPPERKAIDFVERLRQELQLSDQQVVQVRPAFDELGRKLHAFHTNTIEQVSAMIRKTHGDIEQYLNPNQIEKLRRLQQEKEMEFRKRAEPGGERHPPK